MQGKITVDMKNCWKLCLSQLHHTICGRFGQRSSNNKNEQVKPDPDMIMDKNRAKKLDVRNPEVMKQWVFDGVWRNVNLSPFLEGNAAHNAFYLQASMRGEVSMTYNMILRSFYTFYSYWIETLNNIGTFSH